MNILFLRVGNLRKQPTFRGAVTACFPHERSSEKRAQKFHTDDVSVRRSGQDIWWFCLGETVFPHGTTNQKLLSCNLENKKSSVPWRREWLTFFSSCTCIRVNSIIIFSLQWRYTVYLGYFIFGKIQIRISESKNGLCVFSATPKMDHETIKSTLWVDYSDHFQIRNFDIHNLNVFLGKHLKKVFLTSGFPNKNVWHSNWAYVGGILTLSR